VNLETRYLGLELRSPLVASASPLCGNLTGLRALEEAGVGAVVLPSLFEEQIEHEELELMGVLEEGSDSFAEATTYFPEPRRYVSTPDEYLEHVRVAKRGVSIPVIGSLNGTSAGGWLRYARLIEGAGADALELNVYAVETDPTASSAEIEARILELIRAVRATVEIPLAVKIGPFYTSVASMAARLVEAGADGLVLFNRFVQPDIDLETLEVAPRVQLSTSAELLLALRWTAILHGRIETSLAASGGVHSPEDVVKLLLAGADVAMTTSALLEHGPSFATVLLAGLTEWLEEREYDSVEQFRGSISQVASPDPAAFERSSYMRALVNYRSRV
jgi:dihydroorotate dehydrogenase (fumarate)